MRTSKKKTKRTRKKKTKRTRRKKTKKTRNKETLRTRKNADNDEHMDKDKENVINHSHTLFIFSCHVKKHKCRNKGSIGSPGV